MSNRCKVKVTKMQLTSMHSFGDSKNSLIGGWVILYPPPELEIELNKVGIYAV